MGQSISMGASASRGRILTQIRRALRTALVAKGYEVNDASGGDEAFEKLREETYDVILPDINLPDMKGTDVCRTIRATSDVGIIMLTVRNNEADKVAALDCGANDYVTKPLQYLANRLNKIVQHREILRTIWGPDYGDELDQLRTVVKQLRKKIEADSAEPQYLLTHSWVGYELREPK